MVPMLRHVEWACLFWCYGFTGELSEPDAVKLDQNALSCAWGLSSWYLLGWLLFCNWSGHVIFGFGVWFCNGKCGGANVGWGVDGVLVLLLLVVAVETSVVGFDGISHFSCRPRRRL